MKPDNKMSQAKENFFTCLNKLGCFLAWVISSNFFSVIPYHPVEYTADSNTGYYYIDNTAPHTTWNTLIL